MHEFFTLFHDAIEAAIVLIAAGIFFWLCGIKPRKRKKRGVPKFKNPPPPPPRKDPRPTLEERGRTKGNYNEGEPTIPRERVPAPPPAKPPAT